MKLLESINFFFRRKFLFFINIWRFRKELNEFQPWDYTYNLDIFKRSLELLRNCLIDGYEVEHSRLKKVNKINRVIQLLDNCSNDRYMELAEAELGLNYVCKLEFKNGEIIDNETELDTQNNKLISARAEEIENSEWEELWNILKGRSKSTFYNKEKSAWELEGKTWDEWFDGSGIRGWWD